MRVTWSLAGRRKTSLPADGAVTCGSISAIPSFKKALVPFPTLCINPTCRGTDDLILFRRGFPLDSTADLRPVVKGDRNMNGGPTALDQTAEQQAFSRMPAASSCLRQFSTFCAKKPIIPTLFFQMKLTYITPENVPSTAVDDAVLLLFSLFSRPLVLNWYQCSTKNLFCLQSNHSLYSRLKSTIIMLFYLTLLFLKNE